MGHSQGTQHAIRRSTRLPLEIPVLVSSPDRSDAGSVLCTTTLVNAHGCGLIAPFPLVRGIEIQLELPAKRHTTGRVAEVVPLGGDPESWLIGVELHVPGNFWGIEFAPSDWKIEETQPVISPESPLQPPQKEPTHNSKWKLIDLSTRACYLGTVTPFPVDTAVLLSVRLSQQEYLLDGIVRLSHAHHGMGIEFPPTARHPSITAGDVIQALRSSTQAPKVFVGRREDLKNTARLPAETPSSSHTDAAGNDENSDLLLRMICENPPMPPEDFLSILRAQRPDNLAAIKKD